MKTVLRVLMCGMVLVCDSLAAKPADSVREDFEALYDEWKVWIATNRHLSSYVDNEAFRAISDLRPSALPFMIEKMKEDPDGFHLSMAVRKISKKKFERSDWPKDRMGDSVSAAKMYVQWWAAGRFQTGRRFLALCEEWRSLVGENRCEEAKRVFRQIVNLGLPVLPYLIEAVKARPRLVPAVAELSDGALSPDASSDDCVRWWRTCGDDYKIDATSPVAECASRHVRDGHVVQARFRALADSGEGFASVKKNGGVWLFETPGRRGTNEIFTVGLQGAVTTVWARVTQAQTGEYVRYSYANGRLTMVECGNRTWGDYELYQLDESEKLQAYLNVTNNVPAGPVLLFRDGCRVGETNAPAFKLGNSR